LHGLAKLIDAKINFAGFPIKLDRNGRPKDNPGQLLASFARTPRLNTPPPHHPP
jgi:hypothetical protein